MTSLKEPSPQVCPSFLPFIERSMVIHIGTSAILIIDVGLEGLGYRVGYPPCSDQITTINMRSFLENVAFLFSHLRREKPVIVSMVW
jgi:hypothetical protein